MKTKIIHNLDEVLAAIDRVKSLIEEVKNENSSVPESQEKGKVYSYNGTSVLCTEDINRSTHTFSGVVVSSIYADHTIGDYAKKWDSSKFKFEEIWPKH